MPHPPASQAWEAVLARWEQVALGPLVVAPLLQWAQQPWAAPGQLEELVQEASAQQAWALELSPMVD